VSVVRVLALAVWALASVERALALAAEVSASVVGVLPLAAAMLMSVGVASAVAAAMLMSVGVASAVVKSRVVKSMLVVAGLRTDAALTKHKEAGLVWVLGLHYASRSRFLLGRAYLQRVL
jgi:hypothetical protein